MERARRAASGMLASTQTVGLVAMFRQASLQQQWFCALMTRCGRARNYRPKSI